MKEFVFTDCDLDGAGSYLVLKWLTGKALPYKVTRVNDFKSTFESWYKNNKDKYDRIYILDLDVSQDSLDLVDHPNIVIVDHHSTHVENKDKYKHAKPLIQKYSSCTKLVYKLFNKIYKKNLSDEQKLLMIYIDDYDSYLLKHKNSYHLNIIFWNYQGDRLQKFLIDFQKGFNGWKDIHKSVISFNIKKLQSIIKSLDVHIANKIPINNKNYRMVSVFADSCINEVADHIIKNYKSDIGFVINLESKKVSIRKSKNCDVHLGNLAKSLFDSGGGHEDAAGGILNDKFLTLSKLFQPLKLKIGS